MRSTPPVSEAAVGVRYGRFQSLLQRYPIMQDSQKCNQKADDNNNTILLNE